MSHALYARMFNSLVVAAALLSLFPCSSHAAGTTLQSPYFYSDFSNPNALLDWNQQLNDGGTITSTPTSILLQGKPDTGMAGLILQPGHFPDGDFTSTICFRYMENSASFGSGVGFLDDNGKWVARIWPAWLVQINMDVVTGVSGATYLDGPGNSDWHVYSIERHGPQLETFVDGREIGVCKFSGTMASVFLGSGGKVYFPAPWWQIEVRYVRIDKGATAVELASVPVAYPKTLLAASQTAPPPAAPVQAPQVVQPVQVAQATPAVTKPVAKTDPNSKYIVVRNMPVPHTPPAPTFVPYFVPVYVPVAPVQTYTDVETEIERYTTIYP